MPFVPPKLRSRFLIATSCALLVVVGALSPTNSLALEPQDETAVAEETAESSADQNDEADELPADELPADDVIVGWLESLGSDEFATRERAATRLLELGTAILPVLRTAAADTNDPEVRLRAQELIKQLTRGDLDARIAAFLAGEDVQFEGWRVAQSILRDSNGARELFVEMMRTHPNLATSLEGTPRDRAMAMEAVTTKVQVGMRVERRLPSAADAVAMLLPANDPNVPINGVYEDVLMSVLRYEQANRIRQDVALAVPFKRLVGGWVQRSTLANRQDVLFLALDWDLPQSLPLALQTLGQTNATDTLSIALQTIARFGDRSDLALVIPWLDDTRPAQERGFTPGEQQRTQLGDVAMATIALLHDVPLADVGFERAREHAKFGFIVSEVGFRLEDEEKRKAVRAEIDKLLKPTPPPEKS